MKGEKILKSMVPEDQVFKSWKVRLFKEEKGKDYSDFDDVIGEVFFDFKKGRFDWLVHEDVNITAIELAEQQVQHEKIDQLMNKLNQKQVREAKVTDSRAYQVMSKGQKFDSRMRDNLPMIDFDEAPVLARKRITVEEQLEDGATVTIRRVEANGRTTEYKKVKYPWGGEYFFRNGNGELPHLLRRVLRSQRGIGPFVF